MHPIMAVHPIMVQSTSIQLVAFWIWIWVCCYMLTCTCARQCNNATMDVLVGLSVPFDVLAEFVQPEYMTTLSPTPPY